VVSYPFPPPLHGFLQLCQRIAGRPTDEEPLYVLDCGAGGPRPPLALFVEHGYSATGVDIDPERVDLAREAGRAAGLDFDIRTGDMRALPFDDRTFDAVYEFYSLCHLSRKDHPVAIGEMRRVLKPGGLGFLGFMGRASRPLFGKETGRGEIVFEEGGEDVLHSIFDEDEADGYFESWDILQKDTIVQRRLHHWRDTSSDDWNALYDPGRMDISHSAWNEAYSARLERVNYTHYFYTVQKPESV